MTEVAKCRRKSGADFSGAGLGCQISDALSANEQVARLAMGAAARRRRLIPRFGRHLRCLSLDCPGLAQRLQP